MTPNTHITTAQLLKLAEADVSMPIPAADTATILSILSFLNLSGTFNPRELGLVAGSPIRPGYAYRCGSLEGLDANGTIWIQNVWLSSSQSDPVDIGDFINGGGEEGYCKMYIQLIEAYGPSFRIILEYRRDTSAEIVALDYVLTRIGSKSSKYGGFKGYAIVGLGLYKKDVEQIKRKLKGESL
ncbi:tyrosine phosphatase [Fusarium oxysporum f. sp. albedinis]|nr:tyrosine phosphatase [Fusarium oxysporum f. sp. albedinis]